MPQVLTFFYNRKVKRGYDTVKTILINSFRNMYILCEWICIFLQKKLKYPTIDYLWYMMDLAWNIHYMYMLVKLLWVIGFS